MGRGGGEGRVPRLMTAAVEKVARAEEVREHSVGSFFHCDPEKLGIEVDLVLDRKTSRADRQRSFGSTAAPRASPYRSTRRFMLPMREPSAFTSVGSRAPMTSATALVK